MLMLLFPKHWKVLTSILELRETIRWWDVRSSIGNWSIHQLNEGSPSGLHLVGTVEGSMPTSLATRRQSSFKEGFRLQACKMKGETPSLHFHDVKL
jgi:hypothetical protein